MDKRTLIQPRTLKGFRDYLPAAALQREQLIDALKRVFRSFGFGPIDTPALEYSEILLGKGGLETDKQMFRFLDHGERDVALRFDLTIPLARFTAQYANEIGTPFKRYHIAPVWRGENTQRGRYREFLQCDFDTIGTTSLLADIETLVLIDAAFPALGIERFTVRVNNRKVLSGLLERIGLADRAVPVLRALDKLDKIGPEKVAEELTREARASQTEIREVLALATQRGSNAEVLKALPCLVGSSELGLAGVLELEELLAGARAAGVPEERVALDLGIARGLDYYTGTIYETVLGDLPGIGSCCSGGRYDDLASLYSKERFPGVGASVGLDRLFSALEKLGVLPKTVATAPVLVCYFDASRARDYLALATRLRRAGIGTELYPEPKKLGKQLAYADKRGHRFAVILGDAEWESSRAQVKDLATKETTEVALDALPAALTHLLAPLLAP